MLWKYCNRYVRKFGKLSSGHRTGKGQFSFQSQRTAMPKNVQTAIQLSSFHMLARLYSKSFELDFSDTWTKNFQTYKLDFKKVEEPEIKWLIFIGLWRKQRNSRKTSTSASLTTLKPLTVWTTTTCGKFIKEMGIPDHLTCLLRNKKQQFELDTQQWTGSKLGREYVKVVYCHSAYLTYM